MKHAFETREIALKMLVLHPDNVRAGSGSGYSDEQIAPLAANIAECGLLQPLLVAPLKGEDGKEAWGVLAGGRRLAALKALAADKTVKDFNASMMVPCRIVPESEAAQVTLSFSENAMQLPMDALDRYEAFAAMRTKDGADVATIARVFAITERTVKEALRLGNIHEGIRQAHRDGQLSLEALKAFDAHPDPVVQMEAFEALSEQGTRRIDEWSVKNFFRNRFVRVGDALGQLVYEGYKAAGGEVVADLIEEDSVLSDTPLIEKVLIEALSDAAEARREALGLNWADYLTKPDWELTSSYGRVYPEPVEPQGEAKEKADQIARRMEEIEVEFDEAGDEEEQDRLQDEFDALTAELEGLTTGYSAMSQGVGGVLAIWNGSTIQFYDGMVRPEDMPEGAGASGMGGKGAGADADAAEVAPQDKWSEKLKADMAHIRTRSIGLALAQSPELARDFADYTLIRSILKPHSCYDTATTLRAETGSPRMAEAEGSLKLIEDAYGTVSEQLALDWLDLTGAESFAAFRGLTTDERMSLLAFTVAQTLKPSLASSATHGVREVVEAEALPNIRDVWTPDETYFARLTKPALLAILKHDLAMREQAEAHDKSKKSEIVAYLHGLFAAPFATLTTEQRTKVDAWAPKAMMTPQVDEIGGHDQAGCDAHAKSVDEACDVAGGDAVIADVPDVAE
jgi:ParB family chromosome partitioning protein